MPMGVRFPNRAQSWQSASTPHIIFETMEEELIVAGTGGGGAVLNSGTEGTIAFRQDDRLENLIPVGAAYPSLEISVFADPTTDDYGGAHTYYLQACLGFLDGETEYLPDTYAQIQFVHKLPDNSINAGLQTEQLLIMLLDRHYKLNEKYPSSQYEKFREGLLMALDAQRERVDERLERGVMGELKA